MQRTAAVLLPLVHCGIYIEHLPQLGHGLKTEFDCAIQGECFARCPCLGERRLARVVRRRPISAWCSACRRTMSGELAFGCTLMPAMAAES